MIDYSKILSNANEFGDTPQRKIQYLQKQLDDFIDSVRGIVRTGEFEKKIEKALLSELVEIENELGWKWWTNETLNLDNVREEFIDALHFYTSLCNMFSRQLNVSIARHREFNVREFDIYVLRAIAIVANSLVGEISRDTLFEVLGELLSRMAEMLFKDDDEMFSKYVEKNRINFERQVNKNYEKYYAGDKSE